MDTQTNKKIDETSKSSSIETTHGGAQELLVNGTQKGEQVEGTETNEQSTANPPSDELQVNITHLDRNYTGGLSSDGYESSRASSDVEDILRGPRAYLYRHMSDSESSKDSDFSSMDVSSKLDTIQCTACSGETHISKLVRLPCEHGYCPKCLNRMFENAIKDEGSFPPQCCGEDILIEDFENILDAGIIARFREKEDEYTSSDRTYCHRPVCAAYIPLKLHIKGVAVCDKCHEETCVACKGASHYGQCPEDPLLEEVMKLAEKMRWQRCQNCKALVELRAGCNHITCRCKYEFCYLCGAVWKSCGCPQMQQEELDQTDRQRRLRRGDRYWRRFHEPVLYRF
ncbi:uncharacterized protein GGS22DRAFT_189481 [Annulohypoxylon maeteangense]|uniref:uncharacterized protein n=1 Tax=Annulohypoxylon maeteangense TaxID=1927788 RepID=UPI002007598F|nr:uncharacterized protein GGS22DRAFT_189481 [Annulohypoxylon maeteangense]KAI0884352.1 hypothetical protein GGS22DRAFT_189481 [Annulohypoxylon maeteangense]